MEFGAVVQFVGHCPLVLKHGGVAPGHSQHTGGATQPHVPSASFSHWDPAGAVGGQGPVHAPVSGSWWQPRVVVVVLVVVVLVVVVVRSVVLVVAPTTCLSTGAQKSRGASTARGPSEPN